MKYLLLTLFAFLPILLSAQTPDSISVAKEVDKLIDTCQGYIFLKKFDLALEAIERAKLKAEAGLGKMSAGYAKCAHINAVIYIQMGKFSDALPYCILAKDIRVKVLSKEDPDYSLSLSYLATLYKDLGQYEKAEPLALEAKEIRAKIPGKVSREYGIVIHLLGLVYHKLGQYEKSEPYYLEAKNIFAKKPGKASLEYSLAVSNLAALYFDLGKYNEAEGFFLEAKVLQERFPGKSSAPYAGTLNNLASLYFKTGQYDKAERFFIDAKLIFAIVFGENNENYVSTLTNLASFYYEIGQYGSAEPLFLQAKNILEKTLGKENRTYAGTLTNFGAFYFDVGQYEKAEANYLEASQILEKVLGKNHPDYAMALANLGGLYYETEKYSDAERFLLEAKNIRQKVLGNEHPDYATSLHSLAQLYSNSGQYAKAEPLFQEAMDIWAKKFGVSHPSYAKALQNLAQRYAKKGDFSKAESLFLEAKETFANTLGKGHPNYTVILRGLAGVYTSTNRFSESEQLLLELNRIDRDLIEKSASYFSEKEMLAYLQTYEEDLAQLFSFAQINHTQALIGASYDNALFYNGYLLENACQLERSVAEADSLTRDTFERWQGCHRRLANEYAKPIAERRFVAETEAEAEGYEKALRRKLPTFMEANEARSWQVVRNRLKPGEAAVEFIHYSYYSPDPTDSILYAALVLRSGDTIPHFIPLFEGAQLSGLLNRPSLSEKTIIKHLYGNQPQLRDLFWKPLEPMLHDAKTIYYAPTGLLHRINPAALQDESKRTLSEDRQWVRVGSTRELVTGTLANKSFAKSSTDTGPLSSNQASAIIYGGITYDMDSLAYCAANATERLDSTEDYQPKDGNFRFIIEEQPLIKFRGTNTDRDTTWNGLVNTEPEADVLRSLLTKSGFQTKVQKGLFASEERFKQIGVHAPSPRILHIATHGFSYARLKKGSTKGIIGIEQAYTLLDDPMLRSGLVLAGANYYCINKRPLTNAEDGMLVAYEVRDLNLQNTELAVLSACQTGLGDIQGSEGVYGLQRAFRIAGVKFLIVSLWDVPDEQTQELMGLFYQNWLDKKESLRDAFNHAQQTLREKEPSPYMWAGFVLIE